MAEQGKPTRQVNPDSEFFRSYGIGCAVIFLGFLLGVALIAYFWLR